VLCGLAPTLELLVLFRLLQGATGAAGPGLARDPDGAVRGPGTQPRVRHLGVRDLSDSLIGPVVGGLLVDTVSWRAAFLINVPLVAIALFAAIRHMPETKAEGASGSFDWLGAFVAFVAVGGLAFGAIRGRTSSGRTRSPGVAGDRGHRPRRVPDPHGAPPEPARAAPPVRRRRFATINLSTPGLAPCTPSPCSRGCSCRTRSATRRPRPGSSACRPASS
jgi:hypothetical protein